MINNHEQKHQRLDKYLVVAGPWAERPAAPVGGNLYKDTDRNGQEFSYNATAGQWLSTQQFTPSIASITLTGTTNQQFQLPRDGSIYVERLDLTISQVNAGSGTNFWSWATGTGLTISSGTVDTKLHGAGANVAYAYTAFTGNPVTLAANTLGRLLMTFTQNNVGAGNATLWATLTYRKVG
jgi:hypothetical protein